MMTLVSYVERVWKLGTMYFFSSSFSQAVVNSVLGALRLKSKSVNW